MGAPVDLKRVKGVFIEAAEKAGPAREDYLASACGSDASLRAEVEALLRASENSGGLEGGNGGKLADLDRLDAGVSEMSETPGTRIGRYKLLEEIGSGGFGVVFMAEQEQPVRRQVALKVIKLGMDTRQVIARFGAERQALAMMDHPNIARVFDAGSTDAGRPYFVMELVRGVPLTEFCDTNQFTTQERLELFVQVCQAVQHAHQKGIIHRDLKPGNVLVTMHDDKPVPKVIDFGIAKATQGRLTDATVFTEFRQFIGTPQYTSPEQAQMSGLDVDTRSDIYSLGVILYELLTGVTPLDPRELRSAALADVQKLIREAEPVPPSTRLSTLQNLGKLAASRRTDPKRLPWMVRGELDWIVMKCLEKDRGRRYETANALALDIQRYLRDEPVSACPLSATYRFRKFVHRHKVGVVTGIAIAAAVLLGALGTTGGMIWALRERKAAQTSAARATMQAERSNQVAQFLEAMLEGVAPGVALGRDTTLLREVVDTTSERIDKELDGQPEVQAELRLRLAHVYYELQLYREGERVARHALEAARARIGEENTWVADALQQRGRALSHLREFDEAETSLRRAVAMERRLRGEDSEREATALCSLSDVLRLQAKLRPDPAKQLLEAEAVARQSLAIRRKLLGNDHDLTGWSLVVLSLALQSEHKYRESEAAIREAHAIRVRLHGHEHPFTAIDLKYIGLALLRQDKLVEAEKCVRESLEVSERMEAKATISQAETHSILAEILTRQGKLDEAETHCRTAVAIAKQELGEDYLDLPVLLSALADVLAQQGKLAEARQYAAQSVDICNRHPNKVGRSEREKAAAILSEIRTRLGDDSKAPKN